MKLSLLAKVIALSMVGTLGIVQPAFGDANPTVSISSPSTGTTAKGKLAISTRFAADPSGTATINDIGISIANAPVNYTGTLTLNGVTAGPGILGTTNVDAYWSAQYWSGSSATFYVDTTSWPAGSYSIAVTVLDTNNRSATSTPVVLIVPKLVVLSLAETLSIGSSQKVTVSLPGINSLSGGLLNLESSNSKNGPFSTVGAFSGSLPTMEITTQLPIGTWVRATLTGSSMLMDGTSRVIQLLGVPILHCFLPSTAKVNVKISGKCKFDSPVNQVSVSLNVNSGNGWHSLGAGSARGLFFPLSVVGKFAGTLKVQVASKGLSGVYQAFSSNIISVKVDK